MSKTIEIFGTLGPACFKTDVLEAMFAAGMSGMRLNMSHGGLVENAELIHNYQQAANKYGIKGELLIDLQGPELRTGSVVRPLLMNEGGMIQLKCEKSKSAIVIPHAVFKALEVEDHVLIDDGKIELVVKAIREHHINALVLRGGTLTSKKSVKIVDKAIHGPVLTNQDRINIKHIHDYGVTAIMQPFVQSGDELKEVKAELSSHQVDDVRIFAKIENKEGIRNLDNIIPECDMVVIARGDLGNDMPLWELPAAQKQIEHMCKAYGKPYLVVTQMLDSMIERAVPTRAEVSDIFHAVYHGCDAVMVTNETTVGKYPIEVIRYLSETVHSALEFMEKD